MVAARIKFIRGALLIAQVVHLLLSGSLILANTAAEFHVLLERLERLGGNFGHVEKNPVGILGEFCAGVPEDLKNFLVLRFCQTL